MGFEREGGFIVGVVVIMVFCTCAIFVWGRGMKIDPGANEEFLTPSCYKLTIVKHICSHLKMLFKVINCVFSKYVQNNFLKT